MAVSHLKTGVIVLQHRDGFGQDLDTNLLNQQQESFVHTKVLENNYSSRDVLMTVADIINCSSI